jgi:hypothetical protein
MLSANTEAQNPDGSEIDPLSSSQVDWGADVGVPAAVALLAGEVSSAGRAQPATTPDSMGINSVKVKREAELRFMTEAP